MLPAPPFDLLLAVFVVAIRLRHDIHASLPILIVGTLVMLLVIVGFIYSLWSRVAVR